MQERIRRKGWRRFLLSDVIVSRNDSHKIAVVGVMSALTIVTNFFEFKFFDNQFSLTIAVAVLTGIILGALFGFTACVLGDFIGFMFNPYNLYMPWVGLSTGMFALLSGIIFNGFSNGRGAVWIKLVLTMLTTFAVCTVGINSTGFYFYNQKIGFSATLVDYITEHFGGGVSFWGYVIYRLFFKGQIWNSVFNYALLFITVPTLGRVKFPRK